jgi:uncharacterized phage-associated protein
MYDARQIANWFIQRSSKDGSALSIMSLLKLVYIAHGWNLEMRNAPLFGNKIEAWQYGPVIRDVYNSFRPQGVALKTIDPTFPQGVDETVGSFLEEIYNIYGRMSAFRLSEITHEAGGPWETSTKWGGWYAEIPNELIKSHYVSKRQLSQVQNV